MYYRDASAATGTHFTTLLSKKIIFPIKNYPEFYFGKDNSGLVTQAWSRQIISYQGVLDFSSQRSVHNKRISFWFNLIVTTSNIYRHNDHFEKNYLILRKIDWLVDRRQKFNFRKTTKYDL